jgi:PAS domain S-box-containing protein
MENVKRAKKNNLDNQTIFTFSNVKDNAVQGEFNDLISAFLNNCQSAFYIIQDNKFQIVTPQLIKLTGLSREQLLKLNPLDIVHPQDRASVKENAVKMLRGKRSDPYEFRFIDSEGNIKYAQEAVTSIIFKGKRATLGSCIDLTIHKHMQEELQESEEKYRNVVERANDGICIIQDRIVKYVNIRLAQMWGGTIEEIIDTPFTNYIHADELPKVTESYNRHLSGEQKLMKYETVLRRKDDSTVYAKFNIGIIKYHGKPAELVFIRDITERKKIEQDLKESGEKFSKAFRSNPSAISITKYKGGLFLDVNDAFTRDFGYTRNEVIGHCTKEFNTWVNPDELKNILRKLNVEGKVENEEFNARIKSGEVRTMLFSAEIIMIAGEPCIIAMTIDISKRKKIEQALKESEEKFSNAFRSNPNAITISTLKEGVFLDVNDDFIRENGYTRDEVIGHTSKELDMWVYTEERDRILGKLRADGRAENEEYHARTKSGEICIKLFSADLIHIAGEPCIIAMTTDITELKKTEQALRDSQEKFSVAFRSSPEMIVISNEKTGVYIEANDSFIHTTGYTREEFIGHPVSEINMLADPYDSDKMFSLEKKQGKIANLEYRFRMKSGEIRNWLCSTEKITIGGDPCSIAVATDITERKKMENELRKHRDHLEELVHTRTTELESLNNQLKQELTERKRIEEDLRDAIKRADAANQAKSDFLARMSHEIRTPIHGVMGTLDLLRSTELNKEQHQYVNMSKASAETLLSVINDILDFSKIEAGKVVLENTDFELRMMLEATLEAISVSAHRKGLELNYEVSPGVPTALIGDAGHLRQVLLNLFSNAVKFTEHGEIVLRVDVEVEGKKEVELHFSVRDTGIGIPKEKQDILFRPFEQVDGSNQRKYGGTGLGLSICKQLVAMMGGRIWFTSWAGEGSVFHFTARFEKQPVDGQGDSLPGIKPEVQGTRLLLVDDNATSRIVLRNILNEWGCQVTEADNGPSAVKELENTRGTSQTFNLILLDSEMPAMNGFTVAEKITHGLSQKNNVIMMLPSIHISDDFAKCQELGISNYLVKPVKKSELQKMISKALGLVKTDSNPGPPAMPANSSGDISPLHILVAEDNNTSQIIAKKMLEKAGHTVQIAGTGVEAVRMLKEGAFNLVLMDVEMPEMSGLEATRLIRKSENDTKHHIPIIAMTAYAMKEDKEKCLEAGMDSYISKPVNLDELYEIIKSFSIKKAGVFPAVDIETALKFVGGDKDILTDVLHIFLEEDYPEQVKKIKEGINQHDAQVVKAAAHSIKGAVRSLGGTIAGNTALRLEEMGRNSDLTGVEPTLQKLEQEIKEFSEYYTQYTRGKV